MKLKTLLLAAAFAASSFTPATTATFRFAFQGDLKSLDPYSLNETFTHGVLGNVYEGLTKRDKELKIIARKVPGINQRLAREIAKFMETLRQVRLAKVPGVAETLDWAATLAGLAAHDLRQEPELVHETLICLLKTHEDRARVTRDVTDRLLGKVA